MSSLMNPQLRQQPDPWRKDHLNSTTLSVDLTNQDIKETIEMTIETAIVGLAQPPKASTIAALLDSLRMSNLSHSLSVLRTQKPPRTQPYQSSKRKKSSALRTKSLAKRLHSQALTLSSQNSVSMPPLNSLLPVDLTLNPLMRLKSNRFQTSQTTLWTNSWLKSTKTRQNRRRMISCKTSVLAQILWALPTSKASQL